MKIVLELHTRRLHLVAATLELAKADLADRTRLSELLGATLAPSWPPPLNDEASAQWFVDSLAVHPDAVGWTIWYFVLNDGDARIVLGNGGFKGEPVNGTVEIGYSIVPEFQRHGYAFEAVSALVCWAFSHKNVNRVIAETLPELDGSKMLLEKLGFALVQSKNQPGALRYEKLGPKGLTSGRTR